MNKLLCGMKIGNYVIGKMYDVKWKGEDGRGREVNGRSDLVNP